MFIICLVSVCFLALSSIMAVFMVEEEVYIKEKDELYQEIIDGKLENDIYEILTETLAFEEDEIIDVADKGNLIFQVKDENGEIIARSKSAESTFSWKDSYEYYVLRDENGHISDIYSSRYTLGDDAKKGERYIVDYTISEDLKANDFYSFTSMLFEPIYNLRYGIYGIAILCLLCAIASFVTLMSVSGRINDSNEIHPGPLNVIPFDLLAVSAIISIVLLCLVCDSFHGDGVFLIAMILFTLVAAACFFLGLCMSMSCRIKQKTLISKSFTYWVIQKCISLLKWTWNLIRSIFSFMINFISEIPLVWKTALILFGLFFIEALTLANSYSDFYVTFWILKNLVLIPFVLYVALCMRKLLKGGEVLASGDLSYHVDTKKMFWDFRKHGEDLNSIAKGMSIAVEDRMKSERMKTELITNVSHDIKTPLTSIINYADLISKEKSTGKKTKEYAEVLVRQSERLKRLLEDLVEASKASTGNLEMNLSACDASLFIEQSQGEYTDRFRQADLTLITDRPDHEVMIMADGRRMWRIFDNLMNNICKYALSGTRVYLSLKEEGNDAVITFKNTSRDELNISEEELMERFTRGDASRNTEGNGLGLSIARSLCELQNGKLDLSIDGDLFKVTLTFPKI